MSWTVDISDPCNPELFEQLQEAEKVWREVVGTSADLVDVSWRLGNAQGPHGSRPVLWMNVEDRSEALALTNQTFDPDEFSKISHLYDRFNAIWRKLLLMGAQIHRERFQEIMSQFSGD
ncbi:MAG TPA: hypothetical protein VFT74_12815 [Isosphaeraceae bacterium]|nr:hypothetical protein [Isosphaeraceae bacterium]